MVNDDDDDDGVCVCVCEEVAGRLSRDDTG